ncbi:Holliday junction branch migration protein RuvA [Metallumcola ferriviriculae]|uniref:Holliday junction branch migration complex subunit RuvA n=1 Tax=Metallumcola ferriviriculae TaxID=3039180 RepID=A0AAU0UV97_9FIRM|nr:Holliday junction branch migration protein RuvA [Desulfitibacteraceae bacterium MK1]
MIAFIKGVVRQINVDNLVVETTGLGYQIYVPGGCLERCRIGAAVELHTHFVLKEDGTQLFGFLDIQELSLFKMILNVSGIGPKGAMAVLSALGAERFTHAVVGEDVAAITKVPGVGKKTAQRLIIELKDKLAKESGLASFASPAGGMGGAGIFGEVLAALEALGYSSSEVLPVLNRVTKEFDGTAKVEHVIKLVLKQMASV